MAGFYTKTFSKHDDYMTPKSAWEAIKNYIPQNKKIWESFPGDFTSAQYLRELGFDVICEDVDFFDHNLGEIIVSNPPFSIANKVLTRLVEIEKPFILILPSSKINTQYVRQLFINQHDKLQIIIPRKRIQFNKLVDGKVPKDYKNCCNFDCFYYCWKIGLDRDLTWLA